MNYVFSPEVTVGGGLLYHSIYLLGMTPGCTDLHSLHFTRKPFTQLERRAVRLLAPIDCMSVKPLEKSLLSVMWEVSHILTKLTSALATQGP